MFYEITPGDWIEVALCCLLGGMVGVNVFAGWNVAKVVCAVVMTLALGGVIAVNVWRELHGRRREKNDADRQVD